MGSLIRFSDLRAARFRAAGFTLLELLVVMVIIGMTLGMVSLSILPNNAQTLQTDAQRVALLLQLARDEAIVRNRPIAFEAQPDRYRFLVHEENGWQVLQNDSLLRERPFRLPPVQLNIASPDGRQINSASVDSSVRIVFGREPVDQAFVLTLVAGNERSAIHADGIGHFALQ
ncbi:MAG TPA: GspH/FimT family pseudopilin [Oxalicibacterium sp.]|uniref:GspH/FimT family pseudopilin n=1 Tax=Oxalicibacterium sp. TaxID=2766525 RepID=UPI002BB8ADF0|nr:GspH/FimT family pseudopilin [Oxalicibacterium sp.]HWU97060.1 GspH/FimT family pseudopilin [Oxalicibacterium sp.]